MTLFSPPEAAPRRSNARWVVGAALVAALGLAIWAGYRSEAPAKRPPAAPLATPRPPRPATRSSVSPSPEAVRPRVAAAARPAPLHVEADVPDASVFVDHRFVGKAPVDVRDLALGPHRVNVSADGFPLHAEDLELGAEPRTLSVRFNEVRLDESIEVIHKHAVGSCSGVLSGSAEGLAFLAANTKDSFRAPFADLARFDVDYLKKTLRVSLRGGRSYNFTVEGSSADPLLVFQQRVDAARKRLAP